MRTAASNDPTGRLVAFAAIASALIFLAVLAWPLAIGAVWHADDLGTFHLPFRLFQSSCLARGDDPRWCPLVHCGFYLHGEGQLGMDHLWHRLLYSHLNVETAFQLEFWFNYPWLFAGTTVFLRRRVGRLDAALVGALLFTFSGFNLFHYVHVNALSVVAHTPWLLLTTETIFRSPDRRKVALARFAAGGLTASQVLLGYPQYVGFSILIESAFAAWLRASGVGERRRWWDWIAAKLLGIAAGGSQLLPTRQALGDSWRARPPREFSSMNSLHPWNLVQLFAPYAFKFRHFNDETAATLPFHEYVLYAGAIAPGAWAWLWIRRRELGPRTSFALVAAILGAFALVLAFGRHGLVYLWLSRLPPASMFRGPSRFVLIVHFAASCLTAVALADLLDCVRDRRSFEVKTLLPLLGPIGISALGVSALAIVARLDPDGLLAREIVAIKRLCVAPLWIGVGSLLIFVAARGRSWGIVALVAWASADAASYGFDFLLKHDPPLTLSALIAAEPNPPSTPVGLRLKTRSNGLSMRGIRLSGGYVALAPRSVLNEKGRAWNRLAGVGWVLAEDGSNRWEPVADPLPRARLIDRVLVDSHPKDSVERIDLAKSAVVPSDPGLERSSDAGRAVVLKDRPGKIVVATTADSRRLLIVNERFHPGWRAEIGGKSTPIVRTNGDFLGVAVEKGSRVVSLRFDPPSHRDGLILGRIGWTALVLITAASLFREAVRDRRRKPGWKTKARPLGVSATSAPALSKPRPALSDRV